MYPRPITEGESNGPRQGTYLKLLAQSFNGNLTFGKSHVSFSDRVFFHVSEKVLTPFLLPTKKESIKNVVTPFFCRATFCLESMTLFFVDGSKNLFFPPEDVPAPSMLA